ncbi:MAG: molybdopterin-guanine dinucleotide biosynthesis protein B [Parvibaculum sp.]|nr:molybdopterin-guanine dinucleotide biosynthesis protein B [Parvibaculum sp.]
MTSSNFDKVVGIIGWKNSGKTMLVKELPRHFTAQGLRVAIVKRAHHALGVDHEVKDSFAHRQAGARKVIVTSARRWAHMREIDSEREPRLKELTEQLSPADIVLAEGFKREDHPKIEVWRDTTDRLPAASDKTIRAVVTEANPTCYSGPCFNPSDIENIAKFVLSLRR